MLAVHTVHLHQVPEPAPGFDELVIDCRVFFLTAAWPAAIPELLFKDFQHSRQLPQLIYRSDAFVQQVTLDKIDQCRIPR